MRVLKVVTVVMGLLIIVGTIGLMVVMARRSSAPIQPAPVGTAATGAPFSVTLQEPEGTRIVAATPLQDRLGVQLQGGGADRILLIDPHTGAVTGRISLDR